MAPARTLARLRERARRRCARFKLPQPFDSPAPGPDRPELEHAGCKDPAAGCCRSSSRPAGSPPSWPAPPARSCPAGKDRAHDPAGGNRVTRPFYSCVHRDAAGGSGVCWRARQNYDVTKHLHVSVVRPGERVADMHPFSYGLHERRTAYRHAGTLDRQAGAPVWSCSDVACLLDSQRIQALDTPHDWAHFTERRRPLAGHVATTTTTQKWGSLFKWPKGPFSACHSPPDLPRQSVIAP